MIAVPMIGNDLVAARARDQPAAHDERRQQPATSGSSSSPDFVGDDAVDDLEVQREVDDRPEHREADDERRPPVATENVRILNRSSGMIGSVDLGLDDAERDEQDAPRAAAEPMIGRDAHAYCGAAPRREQDDGGDARREQGEPEPVDLVRDALDGDVEHRGDGEERDDADRHVDVEDPPPREVLGEPAAGERAEHARERRRPRRSSPCSGPAGAGGMTSPMIAWAADHQPTGADALDRAAGDELDHRLGQPREHRADQEDHDRELEEDLAAVEVAELAPQRRRDRRGEQVGGHDPGRGG